MKRYDYIFIGAGCAGLSLLTQMVTVGLTKGKNILVIDREPKQKNDHTWCFWEDQPGFFETIVYRQWQQVIFYGDDFSKQFNVAPYRYKMVRAIDFYHHCFTIIHEYAGIDFLYGEITDLSNQQNSIRLQVNGQPYMFQDAIFFNSIWNEADIKKQQSIYLLQHFKGWIVETAQPFFNTEEATLMDFRVSQEHGTTFVYVLPLSATRALVEYTLFSAELLPENLYNEGLTHYLHNYLQLKDYTVAEEEFGVIPMTDAKFPWHANGMYHIGTAGGQTKASSGYTFRFIQKQTIAIIEKIKSGTLHARAKPGAVSKRFGFYDAVLLRVLANNYASGKKVFTELFKNNAPQSIFRFLDNESTRTADLHIICSMPVLPFFKAACKQLMKG